jgi:thiamine kinase-like enzyme
MQQLIETLSQIPLLAGRDHSDLRIERLGGLSNTNYKLTGPEMCIVVRLAGAGTEAYVNRRSEARNARAAAKAGVAPEVLYSDDRRGIFVTRFVEGAQPLDAGRAGSTPYLARIGRKLRDLHTRSDPFANTFNPYGQLDRYVAILEAHRQKPQGGFLDALTGLHSLRGVVDARARAFTPCHCDLLPENILDDGKRLFIIDYEFSGNCDPLWDLGDFSGEANLGESQDRVLLQSYFGGAVPPEAQALFIVYKAVSLLLAAGWAQVQIANANVIEDFKTYAEVRLARCWDVIEATDLERLIGDLTTRSSGRPGRALGAPSKIREHRSDESKTRI